MTRWSSIIAAAMALSLVQPAALAAQGGGGPPAGQRGALGGGGRGAGATSESGPRNQRLERAEMERMFKARFNEIVRKRLKLNDEQFAQLTAVADRMAVDRFKLSREEYQTRSALRRELLAEDQGNETRIAALLEQLPKLERRRIDLLEQEQRDLAAFLAPSQRARYFALQDELRRGMQDTQRRRMTPDAAKSSDSVGGFQRMLRSFGGNRRDR